MAWAEVTGDAAERRAQAGGARDWRLMSARLGSMASRARIVASYPACPNLADQHQLLKLAGVNRIGVAMSDEDQFHPEQSTSAIVVVHPQAKCFSM